MDILEQPGYIKPEAQRSLGLQLLIACLIGVFSLFTFSIWRRRLPQIYAARTLRKSGLPPLSDSYFGWIRDVIRVKDRDVLHFAGLDAYVYLMFFRAAITLLWKLSLVSLFFIMPLRWYYSGHFDDEDQNTQAELSKGSSDHPNLFGDYLWVFVAATYIFTLICLDTLRRYTNEVVSVRQAYLGHQNSITDRTLRISGIPSKLRSEESLKLYFTTLLRTEPESIILCRDWKKLDELFEKREKVIKKLEQLWTAYIGRNNAVFNPGSTERFSTTATLQSTPVYRDESDPEEADGDRSEAASANNESYINPASIWDYSENGGIKAAAARLFPDKRRPIGRIRYMGLGGPKVDLIDHYERILTGIDAEIEDERTRADSRPATNMAFVTMSSVAQCQLAAQAILSPKPHSMVNFLAPAPHDIIWKNVYLKSRRRSVTNYIISLLVLVTNTFLIIPLNYVARFLDLEAIKKHFPQLGGWLSEHKWMAAFVTGVLPTYVFASFNLVVPYYFAWLSKKQGFISKSDAELSTIGKNFFYFFINLFLLFTIESTYISYSVDKIAKDFAHWLIRLSSFYTNLIALQGLGIAPFKLLQPGSIFQFPLLASGCKTARDYHNLYKPQTINYGLILPTPLFIFIVTLTYSILRRRILLFGLIYFAVSYFVFKYQLLYSMIHPQHSNAQLWTVILRRVYLGIAVFHIAMMGVLVLQSAYHLAVLLFPLSLLLMGFWYDFERFTKPLLEFVAVEALSQEDVDRSNLGTYHDFSSSSSSERGSTNNLAPEAETSVSADGELSNRQRLRQRSSSVFTRAEALATLNLNQEADELSHRLWEPQYQHSRTLDEDREEGQKYVNKSLVAKLTGPWVATSAFECVVANPTGFERLPISHEDWL